MEAPNKAREVVGHTKVNSESFIKRRKKLTDTILSVSKSNEKEVEAERNDVKVVHSSLYDKPILVGTYSHFKVQDWCKHLEWEHGRLFCQSMCRQQRRSPGTVKNVNEHITKVFEDLAADAELAMLVKDDADETNSFRVRNYKQIAQRIKCIDYRIESLEKITYFIQAAKTWRRQKNGAYAPLIKPNSNNERRLIEIIKFGDIQSEELKPQIPEEMKRVLKELQLVHGIAAKTASKYYSKGVRR